MSQLAVHDSIAVLDFGGQYVHLIATKVRSLGIHAEIREPDDPTDSFRKYKGLILSGSPSLSAQDEGSDWNQDLLDLGLPVLGFCFGHQEIAKHAGGAVDHTKREFGAATLHLIRDSPLFTGLQREEIVWMSHGDTVTRLPASFVELAYSTSGAGQSIQHRNAAIACESRRQYGLQFHPEVDDTPCGLRILRNFAAGICQARATWHAGGQVEERVAALRAQVKDRKVLLLVSGGVDSTVAALLFARALGAHRLRLLHIDNGLMRKGESAEVVSRLTALGLGDSLHHVDASRTFFSALEGLVDPEKKRQAIGDTFVQVFEREATRLGIEHALLGQGTIYPDTIETGGTRRADVIKTHHNRAPLVQEMMRQGRVVEPLADLYKTEVREFGRALGLDSASIQRHPFPGPGLGIRVAASGPGPPDPGLPGLQAAVDRMLRDAPLRGLLLPVRSVGVKADLRSYEHPVLLVGEPLPWERLTALATSLTKGIPGINRCLFELSGRRPREARAVPAAVTPARLDLARDLDQIVMQALERHALMQTVWQCPTVLVPVSLDGRGHELVVLRPVHSERAMTARPAWIGESCATEITGALTAFQPVSGVAIDLTTKPPATIEWE
ncbi:MAG: glutamine-hydrolyzing GMP synthase [Acidobacteriota bacterium]